jgi:type 1 glutamine amidotransferase
MSTSEPIRVHVIAGGFPPGSPAGHDMDFARLKLLTLLGARGDVRATVAGDFTDIDKWLTGCRFLVTYTAGPYADDEQNALLRDWLESGGRWLGLHGTSGGRAVRVDDGRRGRKMLKTSHHETLGSFFLNHPPVRKFRVDVADPDHALTRGLPDAFEVMDELYLIELQDPESCRVLLTTELAEDPSPPGFGFIYDADTSLLADGRTRALGYVKDVGKGGVAYCALGHCHSPVSNSQPFVDESVEASGKTPLQFRGAWETPEFERLLLNAIDWGCEDGR